MQSIYDTYFKGVPTMESPTWDDGGTYCDCFGDEYNLIKEDAPEFFKLINLLNIICPSISQEMYNKIYISCVKEKTTWESDYYGGTAYFKHYVCDMEKLYKFLVKNKLIIE